jgi:hypothetical protein
LDEKTQPILWTKQLIGAFEGVGSLWSSMKKGTLNWFDSVLTKGGEIIEYIFLNH